MNIIAIDNDVTDVNTDAKCDTLLLRRLGVTFGRAALDIDRATHRSDDARKLDQYSVARGLNNSAAMLGNFRVNQFTSERIEASKRAAFIHTHQSRITDNISDNDCRQFPLDLWLASRIRHGRSPS